MDERSVGVSRLQEDMSAKEAIKNLLREVETREGDIKHLSEVVSLRGVKITPLLDYASKRYAEVTFLQDEMTTENSHIQDEEKRR